MSRQSRPMSAAEWGMLLTLSVLWGGTFFFIGVIGSALPPFTLVLLRLAIAALALQLALPLMGIRFPVSPSALLAFLGMGLLNNVIPFCLIVWGQQNMPREIASGLASILNATTPLFTVIIAHFLTADEKLTWRKAAGAVIGFAGVAIMVGGAALDNLGTYVAAQVACLGAALVYGFAGIFGRRFARMGVPPMATAAGQVTASTLVLMPIALLWDNPLALAMPGVAVWLAVLGLALLSTAGAYILYFRILSTAGATNLLMVTFLIPITAILLGTVFLGETLGVRHVAGMGLIGVGLAFIDGRLLRMAGGDRTGATG
jgi:drug/metabolite transporter (DMT)-like permease